VEDDRCAKIAHRLLVDGSVGCIDGVGIICLATLLEEGTAQEETIGWIDGSSNS